ncbi:MAG: class I SAM-dependent methyltransferase [Candidatus Omnitrophica bacterium]|nr:class I SAM-dependent methyltransferase [Candidatus Omnitrophota bacterium]
MPDLLSMAIPYGIKKYLMTFVKASFLYFWATSGLILTRRIFKKPLVERRHELPFFLNFLRLRGNGVEVGVWKGEYSEHLLKYSKLSTLFSVDPWKEFDKKIYNDADNIPQDEYEKIAEMVINKLRKYGKRSRVIRKASYEASSLFGDSTLDFIYIDANHSYEACKEDLEFWWKKLKIGGVFAGHDFRDGQLSNGNYGVKRAVTEFTRSHRQRLFITFEKDWPTWYLVRTDN